MKEDPRVEHRNGRFIVRVGGKIKLFSTRKALDAYLVLMEASKNEHQVREGSEVSELSISHRAKAARASRKAKGACLSCGLRICPGAQSWRARGGRVRANFSGRTCAARRLTPEEWKEIKAVKEWV